MHGRPYHPPTKFVQNLKLCRIDTDLWPLRHWRLGLAQPSGPYPPVGSGPCMGPYDWLVVGTSVDSGQDSSTEDTPLLKGIYLPPIIWQNCLARPVQLPPTQLTMTATSQPRFRKWWLGLWEFWQVGELSRNSMHRGNSSLFALQESEYEWWDDRYMDNPKKAGASQGTAQIMLWRVMRLVLLPVIGFAFIVRIIASCNVFGVFFPKPFSKYMSFSSVNIQLMKSILKQ